MHLTRSSRSFALNFKKIPYRTHYLSYPDIEAHMQSIGAPPTGTKPDDSGPWYTCPVVRDGARIVADSDAIMEHLDAAYPQSAPLFPAGTRALQAAFAAWFNAEVFTPALTVLLPGVPAILDARGAEYYNVTRAKWYERPLDEWAPLGSEKRVAAWKATEDALAKLKTVYAKSDGLWLTGEQPVYADFVVLSLFVFVHCVVPEDEWAEVVQWHDGLWGKLWQASLQYQQAD